MAIFQSPKSGLWLSPNPFSVAPPGSLAQADNVYFSARDVLSTRRGNSPMANSTFGSDGAFAKSLGYYGTDNLMLNYDDGTGTGGDPGNSIVSVNLDNGGFVNFSGTFSVPNYADGSTGNRMRFVNAVKSVFFNTDAGLFDYDGIGQPYLAGNPQGLMMTTAFLSNTLVTAGWQAANTQVAYRYTVCSKDAFGRFIEGPPSGRLIQNNSIYTSAGAMTRTTTTVTVITTGHQPHGLLSGDVVSLELSPSEGGSFSAGSVTVIGVANAYTFSFTQGSGATANTLPARFNATRESKLRIYFPTAPADISVTTNNFIRLYRSEQTPAIALTNPLTTPISPDDELFLVFESPFLTSTDISNGFIDHIDETPESFIALNATPLYTNPNTGDGSLAANFQPPVSIDVTYWNDQMWFANTYNKHQLTLTLVGVGSGTGLQNGDTVTIAGTTYTATTLDANPAPPSFYAQTNFDPGYNIAVTAQSLVQCINRDAQQDIFAYYISSDVGAPGAILLVARHFGDGRVFDAFSSRGTAFNPVLPSIVSPPYDVESSENEHQARIYYSKSAQPEAVPLTNYIQVDVDNHEIQRIFPLQFQLLIFKTDGIYYIQVNNGAYQLLKLSNHKLIAPDSVVLLNNYVYCFTNQGLIWIPASSNPSPLSEPIDTALEELTGSGSISSLRQQTFGLAYESERQYLLWTIEPTLDSGGNPTFTTDNEQAFVYSQKSNGFTRYTFGVQAGAVDPNTNSLVLAYNGENQLRRESKNFNKFDYADNVVSTLVKSANPLTITTTEVIYAGDVISYNGGSWVIATSTSDGAGGYILTTLGDSSSIAFGVTVSIYSGIATNVTYNKVTDVNPAATHNFSQVSYLFKNNSVYDTFASFASEISPAPISQDMFGGGWGAFNWGEVPWGSPIGEIYRINPLPKDVNMAAQLTVAFTTSQAWASFDHLGISLEERKESSTNYGN